MSAQESMTEAGRLPVEGELPSLRGATAWLNSDPLTAADLRNRVVLFDFWTYTCINWLRTLPYIRAWAERYVDQGLVVVGVHTPEFSFEKDIDQVRRAVREMGIGYPVALDSDYAVWTAFDNHYWPALYVVDADGRIRHHWFGEGDYERSERVLQQLLRDAGAAGIGSELVSVDARGVEAPADWGTLRSPELYVGYGRTENFASPGGLVSGRRHGYVAPARLELNHWALSGDWTVEREAAVSNDRGGRIACRFHARDLHLVIAPPARGAGARFRVLLDGEPAGADHGLDLDERGEGTVTDPRLYQLVRQQGPVRERSFDIEFLDPGVRACVFTFG
jgi:thiol-disulfide isomerase/thioredoxin